MVAACGNTLLSPPYDRTCGFTPHAMRGKVLVKTSGLKCDELSAIVPLPNS
eukprot:gene25433-3038_t